MNFASRTMNCGGMNIMIDLTQEINELKRERDAKLKALYQGVVNLFDSIQSNVCPEILTERLKCQVELLRVVEG